MSLLKRLEQEKGVSANNKTIDDSKDIKKTKIDPYLELKDKIHKKIIEDLKDEVSTKSKEDDRESIKELSEKIEEIGSELIDSEGSFVPTSDRDMIMEQIKDEVLGFGPINPLINDETVTEIMVNGPGQIFVEKKGKLEKANITFRDDEHVHRIIEKIVAPIGRRIDESMPMVDARLPDVLE
ncbi:Flp pilus assembly CpaF family ATPase [Desulfitispora alkaliphila]